MSKIISTNLLLKIFGPINEFHKSLVRYDNKLSLSMKVLLNEKGLYRPVDKKIMKLTNQHLDELDPIEGKSKSKYPAIDSFLNSVKKSQHMNYKVHEKGTTSIAGSAFVSSVKYIKPKKFSAISNKKDILESLKQQYLVSTSENLYEIDNMLTKSRMDNNISDSNYSEPKKIITKHNKRKVMVESLREVYRR